MATALPDTVPARSESLAERYRRVRQATLSLTEPLAAEDQVVQTMPEVSPTKWHLAHVTWFFEHFVLGAHAAGYRPVDDRYHHLFNSYYYTVGDMYRRPERGLLSRPTVAEIRAYRARVDDAMQALIEQRCEDPALAFLVTLGLHHEQQHQELILTDIKHVLFVNPLGPAYRALPAPASRAAAALEFVSRPGGVFEIGATADAFCFDNETPRHRVLLAEHALGHRLVTNAEYREFIDDGGYDQPALWLSDGWAKIKQATWTRPLCWSEDLEQEFTLGGWRTIDPAAPVCHVSYYEADAFARWAGARLPSEAEWELAAAGTAVAGNLLDAGYLHPAPAAGQAARTSAASASRSAPRDDPPLERPFEQLWGDVWEWCASSYSPYPGFEPLGGSLGEYNGKFMCNQMVVRGGSCATWAEHMRATYRSFFYPHDRWQFLGFRLARDA
jgi:ergothioneine biosynthesis protein EgtB